MYRFYSHCLKLILTALVSSASLADAVKDIYGLKNATVAFVCPYKVTTQNLHWKKFDSIDTPLSKNDKINTQTLQPELYNRLSVLGNHNIGEYNLQISNIRESDEGDYICFVEGSSDQDKQTLNLIVPPSAVRIENVTSTNRLLGTEGQDLTVSCVAVGGKPPPNVTLTVDRTSLATANQSVTYRLNSVSRSYDRKNVTCLSSNDANVNTPNSGTAMFYLDLKPLQPTFGSDPVSTEETIPLVVSCTSTGSRPQATFQWTIGMTNVTSGISTTAVKNTADDTYTVTSTLTYSVNRTVNKQNITCGAYNIVPFIAVNRTIIDVKFAPDINVTNTTYNQNNDTRTVTCIPVGNPTTYTYYRWQHKSKNGVLIRELDGGQNGLLTLPSIPVETRYQDSGEYVCTVSNGVTGRDGNTQQTGSGYVTANAQPTFTMGNKNNTYGEFGKDVDIHVYVNSVPKLTLVKWYNNVTNIDKYKDKYTLSETATMITDTFFGKEVQVDGYILTLTIQHLLESDFNVSYRVEVSNGFGKSVGYNILLESASPPQMPANFTVLSSTESSILLQWEPGYNGGHEQTFHVEYRVYGSDTWKLRDIRDSKQTGQQIYILSGLQEDTIYEVRMYAENKFNKSVSTDAVSKKTIKADSQAQQQIGPIIGGVGGGLAAILIIIVVIWFMIFKRKQDTSSHSKAIRSNSDSEVPDGLQHNILYQSAGTDFKPLVPKEESGKKNEKPSTSETEYAEVQKPNAVYAAVDKTVQQKNVQDKKQKDKKKRPKKPGKKVDKAGNNNQDSEYANAAMSLKDMGKGEEYANAEDRSGPQTSHKNQQGLEYADLSFTKQIPQKGKQPVIHGKEDRTLYSEVDHTKKAPPPPQESAYEETNFKHG